MEWTQDHVLELVNLLYGKPELWDQKGNRNKQLQIEATNDIALQMGRNVREVERKLNYLRAQFSREWLRVRRAKQNNEEYEPKWFAFRPLSFLIYKRHINKPIQDKDREDLMEQSIYFTPYERKLLDVIENSPVENNEFEGIVPELNVSAELATTTPTSIAEIVKKPIEIKARRRSTRKSTPSVKKELYDEQLELLENENLLLSANETPISTVSVKKNVAQQNMTQQNVAQQNMIQQNVAQQNMIQQNVAHQNMIQQNDAQQNMIQQNMAQQNMIQQNVAQQNMTLQNIAQQDIIQQDIIQQNIIQQNMIQQNTPKNHLSPVEHPMKKMRMEKNKQKLRHTPTVRYRNYDLINAKLKFVALQKKFLLQEHQKKEEINRLQLEHEKYKLEITKLEVEKKKLDIQIRSKMVE